MKHIKAIALLAMFAVSAFPAVVCSGFHAGKDANVPFFTKALAARAGSDERTPYVIAPQFPRHETIAANKEPEDGRAVWCDSWADEDKHPDQMGSASDDWRGCGSLDILGRPKTSLDMTPPAAAQGANRYERFRNFERYLDVIRSICF